MVWRLNAILDFQTERAQGQMGKVKSRFQGMKDSVSKANESLQKVGAGIRGAATATAPFAIGVGLAVREAQEFEKGLSAVQSVMLATKEQMKPLAQQTKALGSTTKFTAFEATEGAKFLAQAGFSMKEIMGALPGVLDAAAAAEIGLGEAANIVAANIGAFGLEASQATEVADALAFTTSLTNTDMTKLGEGMKFAAAAAKQAGLTVQETATSLGVMANAGIKGSLGGTALKNALLQLTKPTKEVLSFFGGRGGLNEAVLEIGENGEKQLRPMEVIMSNISKVVAKAEDPLQAAGRAAKIFGLRGGTAFSAFQSQLTKSVEVTDENLETLQAGLAKTGEEMDISVGDQIPKLVALRLNIAGASGTAKEMAAIRLDNLSGAFTLLRSAVSGVGIEMGSLALGPFKNLVRQAADFLSVVAVGFQAAQEGGELTKEQLAAISDNQFKHLIDQTIKFADGFIKGFNDVKEGAIATFNTIMKWLKPIIGEQELSAEKFGEMTAKIIAVGAIAAPILAGMAAGLFLLGPILTGISGLFGLVTSSVMFLWNAGGMAIAGINTLLAATGSSLTFGTALWAAMGKIATGVMSVITSSAAAVIGVLAVVASWVYGIWKNWDLIKMAFEEGIWTGLVVATGAAMDSMMKMFGAVVEWVGGLFTGLFDWIWGGIKGLADSITGGILSSVISFFAGDEEEGSDKQNKEAKVIPFKPSTPKPEISTSAPDSEAPAETDNVVDLSRKARQQGIKQRVMTQPPTEESLASALKPSAQVSGSDLTQKQMQNIRVQVEGRIRGQDINLVQTRNQVEQSERNGRMIEPGAKRRNLQNGAQFKE